MNSAAELRFVRIMTVIVGGGALLFGLLAVGAIDRESTLASPAWTLVAVIAVFGVPIVAAGIVLLVSLPVARAVLAVGAGLYLASAAGSLVFTRPSPWSESAWVLNNTALGTSLAALALPRVAAWVYNGVTALLVIVERVESPSGGTFAALQHGLYSFAFCAVFMALSQLVLVQARRVDARSTRAARQSAEVEAARARHAERGRVDALLHDTVLATLMLASRTEGAVDSDLRRLAADAVTAIEADVPADETPWAYPAELLRDRLARLDPRIVLNAPAEAQLLPRPVAEALTDAAVEAARNSLRHARLAAGRTPSVQLTQEAGRTEIVVSDDGAGFSPDQVPNGRLGLRTSIYGRLARIPGAAASVESSPGRGTLVQLSWAAPR